MIEQEKYLLCKHEDQELCILRTQIKAINNTWALLVSEGRDRQCSDQGSLVRLALSVALGFTERDLFQ